MFEVFFDEKGERPFSLEVCRGQILLFSPCDTEAKEARNRIPARMRLYLEKNQVTFIILI